MGPRCDTLRSFFWHDSLKPRSAFGCVKTNLTVRRGEVAPVEAVGGVRVRVGYPGGNRQRRVAEKQARGQSLLVGPT